MQAAPASVDQLVSVDAKVPPERDHRLFWWKEALIAVVFYAVYSWTRNQFGSNRVGGDLIPLHAFNNAKRVIRFERLRRAVPRGVDPGVVPVPTVADPGDERLLRHGPLRGHARCLPAVVPQAQGRLPAMAQHAGRDDGVGDRRLRPVPADAAAPARRPVRRLRRSVHRLRSPSGGRHLRLRRHTRRLRRAVVVRLRGHGRHLQPVRGDAQPAHRLGDVVGDRPVAAASIAGGCGRRCSPTRC